VGPRAGLDECGKSHPHRDFFFFAFSCTPFVLHPYLCLYPDCPAFCLFVFTYKTQHKHPCPRRVSHPQSQQASSHRPTPQTSRPPGSDFLSLCLCVCTLSVLLCPNCPGFAFCPYCTTHTTQTSMPPAGFESAIPASDRPQTLALDRSVTGIGIRSPDRPVGIRTELSRPTQFLV
jgi:hypothetical protein